MQAQRIHADFSHPGRILTPTYFPPRGKDLYRATPDEFVSFLIAYIDLWLAHREASDRQLEPRENPVSLSHFHRKGILDYILLWMRYQGHVDHCQLAGPPDHGRSLDSPQAKPWFAPRSSFWLTDRGDVFANIFLSNALVPEEDDAFEATWSRLLLGELLPSYDLEDRIFHWGAHLLKWFRQPAENQELVLCAEEELDWPKWMDDPLPRKNGKNSKIRVHNTIKDLNRHQQIADMVHFQGDGTGTRIGWQYPESVAQALTHDR
jgi:hypothetical protein